MNQTIIDTYCRYVKGDRVYFINKSGKQWSGIVQDIWGSSTGNGSKLLIESNGLDLVLPHRDLIHPQDIDALVAI